jgi:hypothetical protein
VGPAHRPVDAPWELEVAALTQVDVGGVLARAAVVVDGPLVDDGEGEGVAAAVVAEAGQRQPVVLEAGVGGGLVADAVEDGADVGGVFLFASGV